MSKRTAERQITKDDAECEGEDGVMELGGPLPKADQATLAKRKLAKARRSGKADAEMASADADAAEKAPAAPAKPTFSFGAPAPAPAKPAAAPAAAVNPLFARFMPKAGEWDCPSCEVRNDKDAAQCKACETDKPGTKPAEKKEAPKPADKSVFSFGAPALSTNGEGAKPSGPTPQFSFGAADGSSAKGGFTFGAGVGTSSSFASVAAGAAGASFTFSAAPPSKLEAAAPLQKAAAPEPKIKGQKEASGEEDEETLYKGLAKVYRMVEKKWTESGKGELHVNKSKDGKGATRVVMRTDKTHRVVLNSPIVAGLKVLLDNDKFLKFATMDWTQEGNPVTQFLLRFPSKTEATKALEMIEAASSGAK